MFQRSILALLFFLFGFQAFSQITTLSGTVYDLENKRPMAYATIANISNTSGTLSNEKGEFRLLVKSSEKSDSICISFVGFQPQFLSLNEASIQKEFYLKKRIDDLAEVEIIGLRASSVIQKAIAKIPENYFSNPYASEGFYRVTSQKNQEYIHLSEAVFALHNTKEGKEQFKLNKMRAIKDERASRGLDLGMQSKSIFEFDCMNHLNEFDLFNKKGMKMHQFRFSPDSRNTDPSCWKISFDQMDGLKKPGWKGWALVDKQNFAIVQLEFGLSPKGIQYFKYGDAALRALMGLMDIHIDMTMNSYQIIYKKIGERYYLSHAGNDARLRFRSSRDHYDFEAETRVDYLVSSIHLDENNPFSKEDIMKGNGLIELEKSDYDKAFWEEYTIILPNTDFAEIVKTIQAKNEANDLKLKMEDRLYKLEKNASVRIDSILSFYNQHNQFNGVALIQKGDSCLLRKAFDNGLTNNHIDKQYRIGSASKTFTAMLIMQLENEGLLALEDSVGRFLPEYRHGQLKIFQLLNHTSGLSELLNRNDYMTQIMQEQFSLDEIVNKFCSDSLIFEPGERFDYSNSGFILLGRIIEEITQKSLRENCEARIFEPLEMTLSSCGWPYDEIEMAEGFLFGKPEPVYSISNVAGAGAIVSTADDLLKWSQALDRNDLLPKTKSYLLFQPSAKYEDWDGYYGFGWMIDEFMFKASKKHKIVYHPGTDFGFYTMFLKQPDEEITIILLNNTGDFPRFEISDLILDELN